MKILLTGATGYIGQRLMARLKKAGHDVVALVRSKPPSVEGSVIEGDLLNPSSLQAIPKDIEAAYYLVHSMRERSYGFAEMEAKCAHNFIQALAGTQARQIIYLSGLTSDQELSEHMLSRRHVEAILRTGKIPVTVLRAGIIIGSGSASFEILRDLVRKLPVMIGPRWVHSLCQPIAIDDVLYYLEAVLKEPKCLGETFDIGGPDILSYREMLLRFAKVCGRKRWIVTLPVLTPRLSSLWLYFVTSVNFSLAQALVASLTTDAICREHRIQHLLPHTCLRFDEAVRVAL